MLRFGFIEIEEEDRDAMDVIDFVEWGRRGEHPLIRVEGHYLTKASLTPFKAVGVDIDWLWETMEARRRGMDRYNRCNIKVGLRDIIGQTVHVAGQTGKLFKDKDGYYVGLKGRMLSIRTSDVLFIDWINRGDIKGWYIALKD